MGGKKVEETSNNGMISYYSTTFLLFIALSVNCAFFFLSYKDVQCIAEDPGPIPEEEPEEEEDAADAEADPESAAADGARRALEINTGK
jgi:hypothetical protein